MERDVDPRVEAQDQRCPACGGYRSVPTEAGNVVVCPDCSAPGAAQPSREDEPNPEEREAQKQRNGHLYWLLAYLLEQLDWERRCAEEGWEPHPLSWRHADIEAKARDEIAETVQWWEHAQPERTHRLVGGAEPVKIERRWSHRPGQLVPTDDA
jgi:hypothetical protein